MDELRLILIGVGVVVIVAVYLLGRRRIAQRPEIAEITEAQRGRAFDARIPPQLDDEPEPMPAPGPVLDSSSDRDSGPEMLVTLHVTFQNPRGMGAVREALEADGLALGRHRVFHRNFEDGESVFLVANMVEPGVLDGDELDEVPGLSLFCQLPGPRDPTLAFADVIATARRLATNLGGEVLDSHRSTLTKQTARLIREEIIAFQRRISRPEPT